MENKNIEDQSEILTNIEDSQTFYKLYNVENNVITNILNKYEKTKIIYERYQMIANGSLPYISNPEKYDSIYDIVEEELKSDARVSVNVVPVRGPILYIPFHF